MLMAKRIGLEIMAEILILCKQPQTKTRVMYRTNLSWRMLQKYLSQLQSRELLEIHHSLTKYTTTRKGLKFVEKWRELVDLLSLAHVS
jgi:predicted transcriptional regulator